MAKITLTTPESRDAIVPTNDVTEVRIAYPVSVDNEVPRVSFRFHKGHISGPNFVPDSTSNLVTINPPEYATYMTTPPGSPETLDVVTKLEKQLLQYLIDQNLIVGTIS